MHDTARAVNFVLDSALVAMSRQLQRNFILRLLSKTSHIHICINDTKLMPDPWLEFGKFISFNSLKTFKGEGTNFSELNFEG